MVIRRVRIGHQYFVPEYLIMKDDQTRNELLLFKHKLIEIGVYQNIRNKYNTERSPDELFRASRLLIQFNL